jgi:hypothetical protein
MKIKIDYPINGEDVDIFVEGVSDGQHYEIYKLIAKLKSVEIFRMEEEQSGLLAETELAEEIINIAKSILNDKVPANY